MPIIEDTPSAPPSPAPGPLVTVPPTYKGVATDTRYTPQTALLTHIEGSSWIVDYYNQVLAQDSSLSGQNMDRDAAHLQYRHIKNFELKVTTALTQPNQDQNSKSLTSTGQANMYPCGVIPNEGDMFVAQLLNGTYGVFRITMSEVRSIYEESGWIVDYVMIGDATPDRLADFKEKTVEELVYVSDFLLYGQRPLISTSEFDQLRQLDALYDTIVQDYFRRFVSNEYRTLLVPGQNTPIYDPFLTHAVLSIFSTQDTTLLKYVKELNISGDDTLKTPTIWDVVVNKKPSEMIVVSQKMGLVSTKTFSGNPMTDSIRYSGVAYVVYPAQPQYSEDDLRLNKYKTLSTWQLKTVSTRVTDLSKLVSIADLPGLPQRDLPPINRFSTDYYVFSEAFYKGASDGLSALEVQVLRFLSEHEIDIPALLSLALLYQSWGPMDQFYQVPMLLILIKAAIRRM